VLRASAAEEAAFVARYGEDLGRSCWAEFAQKRLDAAGARAANERLAATWDRIRQAIARVTLPALALADILHRAGSPTVPEDLGWPRHFYHRAVRHARDIRARYTFLDLAADSEKLEPVGDLI
jgi:glycerol-1-phosphate dehydrogenase [NAD(P)+]